MLHYIVEQKFPMRLTDEQHDQTARQLDPCLKARSVSWVQSFLATDRLGMLCEFEAESAEAVRDAYRSADLPFARIWQAHKHHR